MKIAFVSARTQETAHIDNLRKQQTAHIDTACYTD